MLIPCKSTSLFSRCTSCNGFSFYSYLAHFRRLGVNGVDLLSASDEILSTEYGIKSALHLNRARLHISKLISFQEKIDKERDALSALKKSEQAFFDMEAAYVELTRRQPPYQLPNKIDAWRPIDVFFFMKQPANNETLAMFLKPLALKKIGGKELLELVTSGKPIVCSCLTSRMCFIVCNTMSIDPDIAGT